MHRPIATVRVWKPIPMFMGSVNKPWHAAFLEVHVMGIERSMFRDDFLSLRYNQAAAIEWMYDRMGLIMRFSLN